MALTASVSAHQQKVAISTILFNDRTQNIEVMHRFQLHDAEHAVKRLFEGDADIYQSEKTQQDFVAYVLSRFSLQRQNGETLPLTLVGSEVDGKHMWVYQEVATPADVQGLTVTHEALRDIWPKQTNTVNVEGKGPIKTLVFDGETPTQTVTFD